MELHNDGIDIIGDYSVKLSMNHKNILSVFNNMMIFRKKSCLNSYIIRIFRTHDLCMGKREKNEMDLMGVLWNITDLNK